MRDVAGAPSDGRIARGLRAKTAITTALLDLLTEGVEHPTAAMIAERAGVSLRLVFHHFEDLEAIYSSLGDRQFARIRAMLKPIDPKGPLDERIEAFVRERARIYEFIAPVRRAGLRLEAGSPEITRMLKIAYRFARDHALSVFAPELSALSGAQASRAADALDSVSSWDNWDFMRRRAGLSARQAARVMELMIRGVLAARG